MNKLRIRVAVLVGCSILLTFLIIAAIYNVSTRSYLSSEVKKSIDNVFVLSYENYDESYLYIPECFYIEERLLNNSAVINSGRKTIASASPTANRAYTSVSRYAASTYSVEAAAAAHPPPNKRLAAAYMPAAAPMFRLMSSMLPT